MGHPDDVEPRCRLQPDRVPQRDRPAARQAIVAEGLRPYGIRDEAGRVAWALFEAAEAFEYRLPEVFAGYDREVTRVAVEYPTASRPQAWAAAAPLLAIRTILGLDADGGRVAAQPSLPASIRQLRRLAADGEARARAAGS